MEDAPADGHIFHDPVAFALRDNKWLDQTSKKSACVNKCRSIMYLPPRPREDGQTSVKMQDLLVNQGKHDHLNNWKSLVESGEVAEGGELKYKSRRGRLVFVEGELRIQEISPSRGMESTEIETREGNDAPLEPHNGGRSGTKISRIDGIVDGSEVSGAGEATAAGNEDGDLAADEPVERPNCSKVYPGRTERANLARHLIGCSSGPHTPPGGSEDRHTARDDVLGSGESAPSSEPGPGAGGAEVQEAPAGDFKDVQHVLVQTGRKEGTERAEAAKKFCGEYVLAHYQGIPRLSGWYVGQGLPLWLVCIIAARNALRD